jgi:hypothetical protein
VLQEGSGKGAVDQTGSSRTLEAILAAAARVVRGVPGINVPRVYEASARRWCRHQSVEIEALRGWPTMADPGRCNPEIRRAKDFP